MRRIAGALLIIFVAFACEGKQGPMGPEGPEGPQGEPGPGTRYVYQGLSPIIDDPHTVGVPEIIVDDMPLVSVYLRLQGTDVWFEIPFYFEGYPDWGMACFISDHTVTFSHCQDCYYKIVVVI